MSAITYSEEKITDDLISEMNPITEMHWMEIAHYHDIPLEVDWDSYKRASEAGVVVTYIARDNGVLIGYALFLVGRAPHYMGSLQAKQDVIFLSPQYRRGGLGKALIAYCDQGLAAKGVQVVYHHVKLAFDFGQSLLEPEGYEPIETVWGKRLDR